MKHVIFDLDGTIANTSMDVLDAFKRSFDLFGLNYDSIDSSIIGPPAIEIIKRVTNADAIVAGEVLKVFREFHDTSELKNTLLMPNALETLIGLTEMGCKLSLATNKPRSGAINILNKFNLGGFFESISCLNDPGVNSKYDAIKSNLKYDLKEYVMVGDAAGDILAAKQCGIDSIAYTGGFGCNKKLIEAEPSYVIDNLTEILSLISSLNLRKL